MPSDPPAPAGPTVRWTLNGGAFDRLLAALDADRDRGAHAYEQLRQRLIALLQWWGASPAEDLADLTLDRVARKLEQGAVIPQGSLPAFVRGVARMIVHESNRQPRLGANVQVAVLAPPADADPALDSLDRCLEELEEADRRLVLRYYDDGKAADARRRQAADLGISSTALRIRAHRVRQRLERCLSAALARGAVGA